MFGTAKLWMILGAVLLAAAIVAKGVDAIGDAREAKVVAKYEKQIAENVKKARATETLERSRLNKVSADYEQKLTDLRNTASPIPIIVRRNCPKPVPSAAAITGEPVEAPAAGSSGSDGSNSEEVQLSNDLRDYAIEAQACALQLTAVIQAWPR